MRATQSTTLVLAMVAWGCAIATRPVTVETIAVASIHVVSAIGEVQEAIIVAESQGVITTEQAARALIHVRQAVELSGSVPSILRAAHALDGLDQQDALEQVRSILFTASQSVSGIALPDPVNATVRDALTNINALLLRVHDLLARRSS